MKKVEESDDEEFENEEDEENEDEISLENLADEIEEDVDEGNSIQRQFSANIENFLQEIVRDASPVLERISSGSGASRLEGAFSGFENLRGESEEDEGGINYATGGYQSNEKKNYDDKQRFGTEANPFETSSIEVSNLGRDVSSSHFRETSFVNPEMNSMNKDDSLREKYFSPEKVDVAEAGKKRENLFDKKYEFR